MVAQLCLTLATPSTVIRQAPLSMGVSRQPYWSGLPFPCPGDLPPTQGLNPGLLQYRKILYLWSHQGSPSLMPQIGQKRSEMDADGLAFLYTGAKSNVRDRVLGEGEKRVAFIAGPGKGGMQQAPALIKLCVPSRRG